MTFYYTRDGGISYGSLDFTDDDWMTAHPKCSVEESIRQAQAEMEELRRRDEERERKRKEEEEKWKKKLEVVVGNMGKLLGKLTCSRGHHLICLSVATRKSLYGGNGLSCDICDASVRQRSDEKDRDPIFCCPFCEYDLCMDCASKALTGTTPSASCSNLIASGLKTNISGRPCSKSSNSMLYCGQRYSDSRVYYFGKGCDGCCGPTSGIPCPDCFATFEIAALSTGTHCSKGHLLIPTLYWTLPEEGVKCRSCGSTNKPGGFDDHTGVIGLTCEECGVRSSFICSSCAMKTVESKKD